MSGGSVEVTKCENTSLPAVPSSHPGTCDRTALEAAARDTVKCAVKTDVCSTASTQSQSTSNGLGSVPTFDKDTTLSTAQDENNYATTKKSATAIAAVTSSTEATKVKSPKNANRYHAPVQIKSPIGNSTRVASTSSTSTARDNDSTIGSVLSSLIPEALYNLWAGGSKKVEESWVPTDPNEIVTFPEMELASYDRIFPAQNVESPFQVRRGPISTKNVLEDFHLLAPRNRELSCPKEDVLCHLLFIFVDGSGIRHFLTIYRSENADDVVELCQRCRDCCRLFRYIDKRKEDPAEFVHKLLDSFREHMLWRSPHIAAFIGMPDVFIDVDERRRKRMLSKKCHPEGWYPLMIAILYNQMEVIEALVTHGATLTQCDINGNNCLHFAAQSSQSILQLLWNKARPEMESLLDVVNSDGCTPLYLAIRRANARCVSALLGYGASVNVRSGDMNPFFEAIQDKSKTLDLMQTLVTETRSDLLYERDARSGNTVLHVATQKQPLIALLQLRGSQLDLNAANNNGQTPLHIFTHKDDLELLLAMASYEVDLDSVDNEGRTPLCIAVSRRNVDIVRALLVLGANPNAGDGEKPRHLASRFNRSNKEGCEVLRSLIMCGARRCSLDMSGCALACANYDTLEAIRIAKADSAERTALSVNSSKISRNRDSMSDTSGEKSLREGSGSKDSSMAYGFDLDPDRGNTNRVYHKSPTIRAQKRALQGVYAYLDNLEEKHEPNKHMLSALALDGGGMRGLVTLQMLLALQKYLDAPVFQYFDWVSCTSTGSLITIALASGYDLRQTLQFYIRFKDCIFDRWSRPYDCEILEGFLKKTIGKERTLADIKYPKLIIPTVKADTFPVKLELMRNYELPLSEEENNENGFMSPNEMKIWRAIRRSTAAPTYFAPAENKYLDGGIGANNPTLELLSEVQFWNSVLQFKTKHSETVKLGCVLSLGTGIEPTKPLDPSCLEFGKNWYSSARAIKSLGVVIVDQATLTEGAPVSRSRSWCHSIGVPYFRLNAPLSNEVTMDCTDDTVLCRLMWDCVEYAFENRDELRDIAELLKAVGKGQDRLDVQAPVSIERTYRAYTSGERTS